VILLRGEAVKFTLLLAAAVILVRDPTGKWAGSPLEPWFQSLQNKHGRYCCAEADGRALEEGEWDIKDNNYRVLLQGEWTTVPDEAVILGPNKLGKAIVWIWPQEAGAWDRPVSGFIRCFIPGSGV
jgi:hypothetical protein